MRADAATPMVDGLGLKMLRIRRRIRQTAIADRMGVSQPRVSEIEASTGLRSSTVQRYLAAIVAIEDAR